MDVRRFIIEQIDVAPMNVGLREPFAIATGAQEVAANVLVRVVLGARGPNGAAIAGFGEAAPFPAVSGETQASALAALEHLASIAEGCDASAPRRVAALLAREAPDQPAARAAIEMAVYDAFARATGVPLASLFGGAWDRLTTDVTITAASVEHARRAAREFAARGFETLKIKVGSGTVADDVARVVAAAEEAPNADIFLDANGGYDVASAIDLVHTLVREGVEITMFEQPVRAGHGDAEALASVRQRARTPVCADESVRTPADVLRLARANAVDAVNIKLQKCGVIDALTIALAARSAGLKLMIGGMVETEIAMTFSAHFAAGLGGFETVDLDTPFFLTEPVTTQGYRTDGPHILLDGERAGLGLDVTWPPPR